MQCISRELNGIFADLPSPPSLPGPSFLPGFIAGVCHRVQLLCYDLPFFPPELPDGIRKRTPGR